MSPKEYYYNQFRSDFLKFVKKTNAHEHPGEGVYIPIQDINNNSLADIKGEHRMLFLAALACTVLIDQIMYTYFKTDYSVFQKMTKYPKFEYGITNINVNPWHIYGIAGDSTTFQEFAKFFVKDLKNFFEKINFKEATWQKVREAMLNDQDVSNGKFGRIFAEILR